MLTSLRRAVRYTILVAGFSAMHAAFAQNPLPPLESFFEQPSLSAAVLSPDGRSVAVRVAGPGKRNALGVIKLGEGKLDVIAYIEDSDVGVFQWVNDQRIVFSLVDEQAGAGTRLRMGPGLYAVNLDGGKLTHLVDREGWADQRKKNALLPWNTMLSPNPGKQDSEMVYVLSPHRDGVDLQRLNTVTRRTEDVDGPKMARGWLLDQDGQPRVAVTRDKMRLGVSYRDPATAKWRQLVEYDLLKPHASAFQPIVFAPDGTLYVAATKGGDKMAVYTYDLAGGKLSDQPVFQLSDYDFAGTVISDGRKVLGFRYHADETATLWVDERMKRVQGEIDALLPQTSNVLTVASRASTPFVLVTSYSDVQPLVFMVYNTETKALSRIGKSYPNIKAAQMGSRELVRYQSRDGLSIPAYLTVPQGADRKNLPMVVLVHGGPYARGSSWGWHPEAAFLASRGYAVLEPAFRGSTGYGDKHFKAGWKQWGLGMQNDLADGAQWAVSQGIADGNRICIAGASYGGYATLMGLVNDPGLYRCGINWTGVTDIQLLYKEHWLYSSDASEDWKKYGMPVLIGDPVADAAQLKATSPVEQAARIKAPLLLAYGGADQRVPLVHGLKFRDAVKSGNPNVEWVEYQKEGHGWALQETRLDFWTRVEKFLDRHIGKGAAAMPAGGL